MPPGPSPTKGPGATLSGTRRVRLATDHDGFVTTGKSHGQVSNNQIYAKTSDTHPKVIYLTIDDLLDEASKIDGSYQTIGFKNVLRDLGLPAIFLT